MFSKISPDIAINSCSIPPMKLIERNAINPQNLAKDEYQQVALFSIVLTTLQDYANVGDTIGINYISRYYSYFCEHYNSYSCLPEGIKPSFQVANFSPQDSFIGLAFSISICTNNYFDDFI